MKAIATEVFEAATQETVAEECDHCHPAVGIATQEEAVDTKDVLETQCGTFVTVCKPLHQGDAPLMGDGISKASPDNLFRKLLQFQRQLSSHERLVYI